MISQFLNNEPRYLEPMLDALESWAAKTFSSKENDTPKHGFMVWQENFIMLLWLSHLLLAPFDLSSMSSGNAGIRLPGSLLHVDLPTTIPPIAKRLVHMSTYHLSLPSKAREAAGTLLVRLALRTDMHRIGLQTRLIEWSLSSIRVQSDTAGPTSIYGSLGVLSFLAGFIVSAENEILKPLLSRMYSVIEHAKFDSSPSSAVTNISASARKVIIKIERALAVAEMRIDSKSSVGSSPSLGEGALEGIIDHFLTALEDKDTPVRFAASKGLSVVALELEPDMVEQIIDMIEERLYEDTLCKEPYGGAGLLTKPELDLRAVSVSRWHGLILALSQLIFRGSNPPNTVLAKVISSLDIALRFEQRSSLGNSVGTSVRDAACFGLWALARRYSTADINSCDLSKPGSHDGTIGPTLQDRVGTSHSTADAAISDCTNDALSTLQILANQLVLAATLDPAGNIRRGASAALQEFIGRHPDEIEHGIDLVQVVDYHGIALRSRAMAQIAVSVSRFGLGYWHSILGGLLDWRGVRSGDASCRRDAARALGLLAYSRGPEMVASTLSILRHQCHACETRNVEERHGLILAMSEIVSRWAFVDLDQRLQISVTTEGELAELWPFTFSGGGSPKQSKKRIQATDTKQLHSTFTYEAVCSLIAGLVDCSFHSKLRYPSPTEQRECLESLEISLRLSDDTVLAASTKAAKALFQILECGTREDTVSQWSQILSDPRSRSREGSMVGVTAALGAIYQQIRASPSQKLIIDTLVSLVGNEHDIGLRCTALESLTLGVLESNGRTLLYLLRDRLTFLVISEKIAQALHACLNDYTTDRRGDVGSLIRSEAINATAVILRKGLLSLRERQGMAARICGLAVEKLDKVRARAWKCLQANWDVFGLDAKPRTYVKDFLMKRYLVDCSRSLIFDSSHTSTIEYFLQFLSLCSEPLTRDWIRKPILEGYVTSAGAGSESLLGASRAAFTSYTELLDLAEIATMCTDLTDLIQENIPNDRLLVPTLEFVAFLFEADVLQRLRDQDFAWKRLFTEVRKAHFKSGSVQKIEAAIRIYAGMMAVPRVKREVQEKLCSMLLHPYPKIRNTVADALLIVTDDESLMAVNWSKPQAELKGVVRSFQASVGVEATAS